jgi:uncharacterized protein with FMN-binding domain
MSGAVMKVEVKSVQREVRPDELKDGTYEGTIGGYTVCFNIDNNKYFGRLRYAVMGMGKPCTVEVKDGELFVNVK